MSSFDSSHRRVAKRRRSDSDLPDKPPIVQQPTTAEKITWALEAVATVRGLFQAAVRIFKR